MNPQLVNHLFPGRTALPVYRQLPALQGCYIRFEGGRPLRVSTATFAPTHVTSLLLMRTTVDVMERFGLCLRPLDVLDMGCGVGNVSIEAAGINPSARITAADISLKALDDARFNVMEHGLGSQIQVVQSDLFRSLAGRTFDLVLFNVPGEPNRSQVISPFMRELRSHINPGALCVLTWPRYFCFAGDWNPTTEETLFDQARKFSFSCARAAQENVSEGYATYLLQANPEQNF